ncbi:DUF1573 domain-containing protein [Lutibacter citreus]|uniref:DUF1573 domain-containing protein n=1 Tax=Lutibacter citreus TaxID=2138210 RepID=UPI000DBE27AF|nr:DUF1573 domain-containing protein [Lutibacter citreus]
MKKFMMITLFLSTFVLFAQEEKGILKIENEIIDYGDIAQNSNGERTFTISNIGKTPITINKVKGSCQCTVVTKPSEPILPGKSAKIDVKYATKNIGKFSKSVSLYSNATEKVKVLRIKGNVIASTK